MANALTAGLKPQVLHIDTRHADEISTLVPGWEQEYIQIRKGQFYWRNIIIKIGEFQFIEEFFATPTVVRGQISKHTLAIGIPQTLAGTISYLGHEITPQTLLTADYCNYFDLSVENQFKHFIMVAPISHVLAYTKTIRRPLAIKDTLSTGVILPEPAAYHALSHYLKNLFCLVKRQPEQLIETLSGTSMAQLILADALPLFVDALTTDKAGTSQGQGSSYQQLASEADRYIREHIGYPITLQALCKHVSASPRSLNYAFQAVYGLPPMAYLKVIRLNQVRRALRRADPQNRVMSIATQFGFWNMPQFAADYKSMFDETPSTTLKGKK